MLPDNAPSSVPFIAGMLWPDARTREKRIDFEYGGVAINDATQGLLVRIWRLELDDAGRFIVGPDDNWQAATVLLTVPTAVEAALAFDQNMRPALAYQTADFETYVYWFDTNVNSYQTVSTGKNYFPRLSLDDKRANAPSSDIIFAYMRDGAVYHRKQRDRFLNEYKMREGYPSTARLVSIGMMRNWRFGFNVVLK